MINEFSILIKMFRMYVESIGANYSKLVIDPGKKDVGPAMVNLFLEHTPRFQFETSCKNKKPHFHYYSTFDSTSARETWLMVNWEWLDVEADFTRLGPTRVHTVLAKTEAVRDHLVWWRKLNNKNFRILFTKHTSIDARRNKFQRNRDWNTFFHANGISGS